MESTLFIGKQQVSWYISDLSNGSWWILADPSGSERILKWILADPSGSLNRS